MKAHLPIKILKKVDSDDYQVTGSAIFQVSTDLTYLKEDKERYI
jgi:hypothetical protein